ncbi:shikimate dehydrogenase [Aggregatilineales bacterium SYSU G02658]
MNRVGIIGFPLSHTLSPAMHNAAFRALGMDDWLYDAMEIPPDIPRHAVEEPRRHGYIGLNVTIPFKETSMRYCVPDEKARAIGAVNTIDFRNDVGTNTDVDGLIDDLLAHEVRLQGETAIVLGAGGAARAAVYGLWQQGVRVLIVNRSRERAEHLLTQLTISAGLRDAEVLTLDEAAERNASLIVNCTPVGMYPDVDASPWIDGVPLPHHVTVYDMIYRPEQTRLMAQVEQAGGRALGGLGMLVRQGAKAFEIWTGRPAPIEVMFQACRDALSSRS